MKVQDIMSADVEACGPESDLAEAASIMWRRDCGTVPVVEAGRGIVGMITDRDICMAVCTRNKLATELRVGEVISGKVFACAPDDDVRDAMETMQSSQLRRLPVVDADGTLRGILSINDIVLHSGRGKSKKHISHRDAMETLKALSEHRDAADGGGDEGALSAALI